MGRPATGLSGPATPAAQADRRADRNAWLTSSRSSPGAAPMMPEITRVDVMEMLCWQAEVVLGPERARALRSALEERADHVPGSQEVV